MCGCHLAFFAFLYGKWGSQNQHKNTDTLATVFAASNELFFISDLGLYSLLPAFMKLKQVNVLAFKLGKISGP